VIRAFAHPGWAVLLFVVLFVIVCEGGLRVVEYLRTPEEDETKVRSERLPVAIVLATTTLILAGFAIVKPITDPPNVQVFHLIEDGLAAQKAGHAVTAAEDYALVLGLDPTNKFARFDLGILQQDAGREVEALVLYQSALRADAAFAPAVLRIDAIRKARMPR
jgi:hypothetical protein